MASPTLTTIETCLGFTNNNRNCSRLNIQELVLTRRAAAMKLLLCSLLMALTAGMMSDNELDDSHISLSPHYFLVLQVSTKKRYRETTHYNSQGGLAI